MEVKFATVNQLHFVEAINKFDQRWTECIGQTATMKNRKDLYRKRKHISFCTNFLKQPGSMGLSQCDLSETPFRNIMF